MKIICAFDSFKGCLTSVEAGEAAKRGILSVILDAEVRVMACADGGEGMAEAVAASGIGRKISVKTVNPLGEPIMSSYIFDANSRTAFIDLAAASGLTLLEPHDLSPERTGTRGTGLMMLDAMNRGARNIMLGLGGSATNDAGLGALQALGLRVYDKSGSEIIQPVTGALLDAIGDIDSSGLDEMFRQCHISLLCDVDNPFIGPRGAVAVFSTQKGADESMRRRLEKGMANIAGVMKNCGFIDISALTGAGAAGGAAGGFAAIAGAEILSGADTLLSLTGFDNMVSDADYVLTGEGSSDIQTLGGKLPVTVLRRAARAHVPCMLLSGKISEKEALCNAGFREVRCINSPIKSGNYPIFSGDLDCLCPEVAAARIEATAAFLFGRLV